MNKLYRFWERDSKRSKTGKMFYVMFASRPGKWISTGQDNVRDAVLWSEDHLDNPEGKTRYNCPTLKQFAEGFFSEDKHGWKKRQNKKNKEYASDYFRANQGRLDNYIIPKFGDLLISAIRPRMIDDWLLDLDSLSDNSRNKILISFRIILDEAEDQGLVKENSARKVTPITERHTARGIFTEKEITTLFNQNRKTNLGIWLTYEWYLFFKIQMVCGLRPGEVAALSWGDFHPELSGLVVSKSYDNNTGKIKGLKTEKKGVKEKVSILDKKTLSEIQEYFMHKESPSPFELFFLSTKGNLIRPESSLKHFKASCTRAGINLNGRTQYSLRHTFDTDLLKHLSRDVVNDLMGHTSYRAEYDHRTPKDRLEQLQHVKSVVNDRWG